MSEKWDQLNQRLKQEPTKTWEEKMARAPQIKRDWKERFEGTPPRNMPTTEEIMLERQKWDSTTKQTFGVVKFE